MCSLTALDKNTVRLLGSTQVITSVFSAVKELIENALDAGATTIDIRLDNYGLDKIEVRDNGSGIPSLNVPYVAKRYHTSKICSFNDIQKLETYGFRGEALGSLCTVSNLSITTKTCDDEVSLTYVFNNQGQITSSHPSHLSQGTTVTATSLFKNLPVRRQFYNTNKKKKDDLKKVEDLIIAFGIIAPKVRFTLSHNKEKVFQKNAVSDTRTALLGILGRVIMNSLVQKTVEVEDPKIQIDMFLPNPKTDVGMTSKHDSSRSICAVNGRPVQLKDFEKLIKQHYIACTQADSHRQPIYFLSVTMATDQIDVNIDPNKTTILLHHKVEILKALTVVLEEVYGKIQKEVNSKPKDNDIDLSREDNSSFTDSNKGDYSSDFNESFTIQSVEAKQENYPVIKITTNGCIEKAPESRVKDVSSESTRRNTEISEKSNVDKGPTKDVKSSDEFGKPDFKVEEISLDDLLNSDEEESEIPSQVVVNTVSNKVVNNGTESELSNLHYRPGAVVNNDNESELSNVHYQSDPKLSEVYGDIVSTWNETQSASHSNILEPMKSVVVSEPIITGDTDESVLPFSKPMEFDVTSSKPSHPVCSSAKSIEFDVSSEPNQPVGSSSNAMKFVPNSNIRNEPADSLCEDVPSETSPTSEKLNKHDCMPPVKDVSSLLNESMPSEENISDKTKTPDENNTSTTTASAWSRGLSLTNDTANIQPVTILTGKRFLPMDTSQQPPVKRRSIIQEDGQRTLSDVLSSQPVRHPTSAFTQYCKDNRSFVVAKNPLADYDEVTRILKTQWESMTETDQEKYYKIISPDKNKKRHQSSSSERKERRLSCRMKQNKKTSSQTWTTIKEQLLKQKLSSAPQKVMDVQFNLQSLKNTFSGKIPSSLTQDPSTMQLIGPLRSSGVWLGYHGNCLKIINPHRIQETVLYHTLMANHVIETEKLEPPVLLSESYLGSSLWAQLKLLADKSSSGNCIHVIQDQRFTSNGIEITFYKDETDFSAKLTGLTNRVPVYGVADVKEVLELISETGAVTLAESRPLKILNYLQGEAVRMARQLPRQQSYDEMLDVLNQMETVLPRQCGTCLHNKPFHHTIYSFDDYPLTQSQ